MALGNFFSKTSSAYNYSNNIAYVVYDSLYGNIETSPYKKLEKESEDAIKVDPNSATGEPYYVTDV